MRFFLMRVVAAVFTTAVLSSLAIAQVTFNRGIDADAETLDPHKTCQGRQNPASLAMMAELTHSSYATQNGLTATRSKPPISFILIVDHVASDRREIRKHLVSNPER